MYTRKNIGTVIYTGTQNIGTVTFSRKKYWYSQNQEQQNIAPIFCIKKCTTQGQALHLLHQFSCRNVLCMQTFRWNHKEWSNLVCLVEQNSALEHNHFQNRKPTLPVMYWYITAWYYMGALWHDSFPKIWVHYDMIHPPIYECIVTWFILQYMSALWHDSSSKIWVHYNMIYFSIMRHGCIMIWFIFPVEDLHSTQCDCQSHISE